MMNHLRKGAIAFVLGVILVLGSRHEVAAQQDPMYTMYMWNTLSVNPGYAGSADRLSIAALSRLQWTGLDGAPSTQSLVLSTPFKNQHLGVGMSLNHDKIGPIANTSVYSDIAYRMHVNRRTRLAFGLKAGVNFLQGNFTELENTDPTDPNFQQNAPNKVSPNFGFGMYLYSKEGYVGIAAPRLLEDEPVIGSDDPGLAGFLAEQRHYFFIAGYVFELDRDLKYRPSILVKAVKGAPFSFDITNMFIFMDKFWAGLAYRHNDSASGILSYQCTEQLRAGYAYDFTISDLRKYQGGSHELMISYDLKYRKHMVLSPRYF